jgi:uncharacterized protein
MKSAFPTNNWQQMAPISGGYDEGMLLMDYFAAKVMQALVSETGMTMPDFAATAYDMAEDMIKERNERLQRLG